MSFDMSHLLDQWAYRPGELTVRRFQGKDGREKLQLRVDLGILQMNVDGRPDGKRPFGHESLFEYFSRKLDKHREEHSGSEDGFRLSMEDCARLQQEALQYHHRYVCLLELEDFPRVIRDTARNLALFDFAERLAESSEVSWALQQFRPQLLLMQTRARGSLALREMKFDEAITLIQEGMDSIRSFLNENNRSDLLPHNAEIQSLESWLGEVHARKPLSQRERLERALEDAVRREDFERAARVRDALRELSDVD